LYSRTRGMPNSLAKAEMLADTFIRSTAYCWNSSVYRPLIRFFCTLQPFPAKCNVSHCLNLRVQSTLPVRLHTGYSGYKIAFSNWQLAISQRIVPSDPSLTPPGDPSRALPRHAMRRAGAGGAGRISLRLAPQGRLNGLPLGFRLAHAAKTAQIVNELYGTNGPARPGAMTHFSATSDDGLAANASLR